MTDTDTIPVSASVASTGLGIRYIGDRCYAYSGVFANAAPSTYLEFTTGSGLIMAKFYYFYATDTSDNALYIIKLNDTEVFHAYATSSTSLYNGALPIRLILPPFTKVEATGNAINNRELGFLMTGRVYGEK